MKKEWSRKWVSSKQPRKQRKYVYNAPNHIRHKLLSAHLSKELRKQFGRRSLPIKKGDEVEIMTGSLRKTKGLVERVDMKKLKVYVEGVKVKKVDGSQVSRSLQPSNLKITKLNLSDKMRIKVLERKGKKFEVEPAPKPAAQKPLPSEATNKHETENKQEIKKI